MRMSADIQYRISLMRICDNTLVFKRKEREMHDNRKQQARAAWKRRQERKRQRNAHAECEACAPKKPEALAEKMSKVWKRIKGAFV